MDVGKLLKKHKCQTKETGDWEPSGHKQVGHKADASNWNLQGKPEGWHVH